MALSGTINGAFTGRSVSEAKPYITWSATQDINANTSSVTVNLYFTSTSTYYAYNGTGSNNNTITIGTDVNSTNNNFTLNAYSTVLIRSRTVTVSHNSDGTKSIWIGANGDPNVGWGTYNFGATVELNTIPRAGYVTNTVDFTVGNSIPLTIWNGGNLYLKAELYVNATLIKTQTLGQVTSATFTTNSTENTAIYNQMANDLTKAMYIRIKTYTSSAYTTQVGTNQDKTGTASINQSISTPTFTTWTMANVAKSIAVKDKYNNTLATNSTTTLLGADTRYIKGYSQVRATITTANRAIARNSATMVNYRFTNGALQSTATWSNVANVTLDLDNVGANPFTVGAFDSRGLSTSVNLSSLTQINYVILSLFNVTATRQNQVDAITNLSFSGYFWNRYFGNGLTTPAVGVLNTLTVQYRYKQTSVAWASQSWTTITPTVDGSGNVSYSANINGDLGASGFDTTKSYNIEVRAYDKLNAVITEITLDRGVPVADWTQNGVAFGDIYSTGEGGTVQIDGLHIKKYIGQLLYPVGSIYFNATNSTNPATLLGFGTWTTFGAGRVPVGYNSGDADFNAGEKTGGAKTHTLSTTEMPAHAHPLKRMSGTTNFSPGTIAYRDTKYHTLNNEGTASEDFTGAMTNTGGGGAHNNLQPFITVFMWKRTA